MKRLYRLTALAASVALVMIASSGSKSLAQAVSSRIEDVYSSVENRTQVPLRVPSIIPLNSPAAPTEYWAASIAPSIDGYFITFDRAEDCTGVEECSFASVEGDLDSQSIYSYQQLSEQSRNENIFLDGGIPAVFSPSRPGIYTPATVYVQIGDYLYSFSIYMAEKSDVVEMANSAL